MRNVSAALYKVWFWAVVIYGIIICLAALIVIIQMHGDIMAWINYA